MKSPSLKLPLARTEFGRQFIREVVPATLWGVIFAAINHSGVVGATLLIGLFTIFGLLRFWFHWAMKVDETQELHIRGRKYKSPRVLAYIHGATGVIVAVLWALAGRNQLHLFTGWLWLVVALAAVVALYFVRLRTRPAR